MIGVDNMLSFEEFTEKISKSGLSKTDLIKFIENALMCDDLDLEEIAKILDISTNTLKKTIAEEYRNDLLIELTTGERLETLIKENGMSADELAKQIDISKATISDLINDVDKNYGYKTFVKLANYFGVSADYLLGLSKVKKPNVTIKKIQHYTGLSEKVIDIFHNLAINSDYELLNDIIICQLNNFLESPTFKFLIDKLFVSGYSDINIDTSIDYISLDDSTISLNIAKTEKSLTFAKSMYFDLQQSILEYYQQTSNLNIVELENFYNRLIEERNKRIKQELYHPESTYEWLKFLLDMQKGENNADD